MSIVLPRITWFSTVDFRHGRVVELSFADLQKLPGIGIIDTVSQSAKFSIFCKKCQRTDPLGIVPYPDAKPVTVFCISGLQADFKSPAGTFDSQNQFLTSIFFHTLY